jgi:hypothetical protein
MIEQRRAHPGTNLISGLLTDGGPATRMNTIEVSLRVRSASQPDHEQIQEAEGHQR